LIAFILFVIKFLFLVALAALGIVVFADICWTYCPCKEHCTFVQACAESDDGTCSGLCYVDSSGNLEITTSLAQIDGSVHQPTATSGLSETEIVMAGASVWVVVVAVMYATRLSRLAHTFRLLCLPATNYPVVVNMCRYAVHQRRKRVTHQAGSPDIEHAPLTQDETTASDTQDGTA
jgi:hypothetical protein